MDSNHRHVPCNGKNDCCRSHEHDLHSFTALPIELPCQNSRRRIRTAVFMDMSHVRFRFSILLCTCLEEPFQPVHLLTTRGSHYITDKQYVFGTRLYIPTHCSVLFLPPNFQSPNNRKGWIRTIKT